MYEGHPVRTLLGSPCRKTRGHIQAVNHRFSGGLARRIQTHTSLQGALHEETLEACILQCATIRRLTACTLFALTARLKGRIGMYENIISSVTQFCDAGPSFWPVLLFYDATACSMVSIHAYPTPFYRAREQGARSMRLVRLCGRKSNGASASGSATLVSREMYLKGVIGRCFMEREQGAARNISGGPERRVLIID